MKYDRNYTMRGEFLNKERQINFWSIEIIIIAIVTFQTRPF